MNDVNKKGIFDPPGGFLGDELVPAEKLHWQEDVYMEGNTKVHFEGLAEMQTSFTKKKFLLFVSFFLISFSIIGARLFYVQILAGDAYFARAERNRQRILPIPSERGIIYDSFGVQLTKNIPKFSLALTPQDLPRRTDERNELVVRLAKIVNEPEESIQEKIEEFGSYSYESIVIKDNLDYETALSIQIAAAELPGLFIQRGSKRLYQSGEDELTGESNFIGSLSHILGYEGKLNRDELDSLYSRGYFPSDFIGKAGVEKTYEQELRGVYGQKTIEVNSIGKKQTVLSEEAPYPGKHLYLSIDSELQTAVENVLRRDLALLGKTNAAVVAMNPQTGAITALVSWPSFDNNDFSGGIDYDTYNTYIQDPALPLFNRAIGGAYPSGSTVKPAIAAAALQEQVITKNTSFLSNGGIRVGDWFFPDWQAGGHGITDVRRSLAWSVNTFYYYIGGGFEDFVGMGVETIVDYLKQFGMAEVLGIDIPGEVAGFLPSKQWKQEAKGERWYVGDTYNVSIGQGDLLATPLQIASMTSVIANGGTLYQPFVVEKIKDPVTGDTIQTESRIIRQNFIDALHIQTVREGMLDCVVYGACRRLTLLPFSSGGKTGTAQWSSIKEDHAWFTAFAPYENPEIVLAILVEEGEGGSKTAAPIGYEILRWWGENRR